MRHNLVLIFIYTHIIILKNHDTGTIREHCCTQCTAQLLGQDKEERKEEREGIIVALLTPLNLFICRKPSGA